MCGERGERSGGAARGGGGAGAGATDAVPSSSAASLLNGLRDSGSDAAMCEATTRLSVVREAGV